MARGMFGRSAWKVKKDSETVGRCVSVETVSRGNADAHDRRDRES